MPKTWSELSQLPEFQNLSREQQEQARQVYFQKYVAPGVAPEQQEQAKSLFDRKTLNRTWGEAATDTGKQLLEGGVNIVNAIPSLIAPDWAGTKALDSVAQDIQDWQSPVMKTKLANANAAIDKAGAEGLTAQAGEALSQYWNDPALASRLVTTNLASLIPGLGSAKIAQATSLARSAKAAGVAADALGAAEKAKAAKMARIAGGVTNSALNAGGARGGAYKDLYNTARQQGYTPEEANQIALDKSLLPAGIGALTGAASGVMGLESGLFGKVAGKSALVSGAKHLGTEITGELGEEALPQLATNWQASEYDQRPLTKDIGRTLVETALATGPNATVAGISGALRNEAPVDPNAPPVVDPNAPPVVDPNAPPVDPQGYSNELSAPNLPVVGPLSAAAQAGQEASLAGAPTLPLPPAPDPVLAQQEADNAAIQQQQAAARQQQADQLAALKIKQEQLKVNQAEQKLGLGPTQFDEPNLLAQAQGLAAMSQPTVDQETTNGLQAETQGQAPDAAPTAVVPNKAPVNEAPPPSVTTLPLVTVEPITRGAEVALGVSQQPDAFHMKADTAQVSGYVRNQDFGTEPRSPTRGELFWVEGNRGKPGTGTSLAKDALNLMAKNGTQTVKINAATRQGKAMVARLQAEGVISEPIRSLDTGLTEYTILAGNPSPASFAPNPENPNRDQASVDAYNSFVEDYHLRHDEAKPRDKLRIATEADMPASSRVGRRLAGTVAAAFGHRVVFVAPQDPTKTLTIDGSISPHDPTTIFLAHDSVKPFTRVAVHEMVHGMRRVAPAVYTDMTKALRQIYDPAKVAEHVAMQGYRGGLTDANEEEWVSNFVSDAFHRPEVLARLARAMDLNRTGAGLEFLKRTQEFFARIKAKLMGDPAIGRDMGAEAAIKELDAAHDHVVKALAQYARLRLSNAKVQDMAPLSPMPAAARPPKPAKGAVAGANRDIQQGIISSASYKPGRKYGTTTYPQGGGNLTRLHERMLKLTNSEDFKRLLDSLGLQSVGAQRTIRGMWLGEPEWTQSIKLKQTNGQPATFEQTRLVANLLGWGAQQDAGLTSMVVDKPVEGAFNIPSLYFGKTDGSPLTSAETDTALKKFAKVVSGATVTPDGKAIKFLFFANEKSPKSEDDQYQDFRAGLVKVSTSVGLDPNPHIAYTLSALDEFNKRTNDDEPGNYRARIKKLGGSLAQGFNAGNLSTGIIGRTVDTVLVPYIVNVRAEGFDFDFQKWGRRERVSPADVATLQQKVEAYEKANKHGLRPRLRTTIDISKMPSVGVNPRIKQATTVANAESQLAELDALKREFPQAADTAKDWLEMEANAFASNDVPIAPVRLIGLMQNQGEGLYKQLSELTPGQSHDADAGFANAQKFFDAYTSGKATQATTGKLLLWSFLSKGVSPYVQEAMFVDAVRGIDPFIEKAASGRFGPAELDAYLRWADGIAKANGQGSPGNATKHNLNAFGTDFLVKMAERPYEEVTVKDEKGRDKQVWQPKKSGPTKLEYLHSLLKDPTKSGRDIRREFVKIGSGVGIDNKVISFTLLVTGRPDVLVLDRIQMRNLFNDGSFDNYNLYDGTKVTKLITGSKDTKEIHRTLEQSEGEEDESYKERVEEAVTELAAELKIPKSRIEKERAVAPGTGLAQFTTGVRGQVIYEFLEDKLSQVLPDVYKRLGRPQDATPGRYHWESWVVESGQEASHGTLDALLADVNGEPEAFADVPVKQGEYGNTDYGARYARDKAGKPYYLYDDSAGRTFRMLPAQWRAFLGEVNKFKLRIPGFRVSTNQDKSKRTAPWYMDPRIDRKKLDAIVHKHGALNPAPASLRPNVARDERAGAQGRPSYGQAQKGSVQGTGVHYSRAERSSLDSSKYGTGMRGQEAARIAQATDPRLKQRVYFYINNGTGIRPETGVGGYTHTVELQNLYDLDADPLYLTQKAEDVNGFESAVLDAGFDGYVADAGGQRAAVLVGPHQVPVQYEGTAKRPDVAPGRRATPNPIKQIAAIIGAPWQRRTPAAFGAALKAQNPDLYAQFADQFAATDKAYWPDEMARSLRPPDTTDATPADVAMWSRPMPASLRTKPDPKKTVKAYKLFRLDPKRPGELFPLFVKLGENRNVPMGVWEDAEAGAAASQPGKVKSTIGQLAYRPGWHAGDLPIATHIGGDRDPATSKPTSRRPDQVWAEVELAADRDWQTEATSRSKQAKHQAITDQVPVDGYYRYKTNPNMTGNWLIGGSMKVNRLLSDEEVKRVNDEAGTADLPRREPLDLAKFGFDNPMPASLRLENPKVIYTAKARSEGSDLDRAIVNARLDEAGGKPMGVDSLKPGDPINTTKQGIANALEKGRGGADLYGNYAYPIFETEAAALQRNQFRPFYADGNWWMDAVTVINGAYAGNTNNRGGINTEAQKDFRTIDRRTADVWEVPHMPYPNTAKDYPMPASLRTWFGKSQITDAKGQPKVMYHGTTADIASFRGEQAGAIFLTDNPDFASGFAGSEEGANVLPVYVSASNVFDYRDPKHIARLEGVLRQNHGEAPIEVAMPRVPVMRLPAAELAKRTATGNWMFVESPPVMAYIKANHDGFWSKERNQVNLGVFKPNQIKSAVGNVGTFDPKTDDIRFSNRPTPPEETRFRKAQRVVQDKFNRFRVVQDWLKEQGVRLSEGADVYRAEERFHARVANQIEDFREQTLKPLVEKTQQAKVSMEDVAQFLHAQHAQERNEAIAKINPNFPDGGSGMATQVALDILNQASPELKAIANEWRAIADDSLQMKVDSGLITPEMADAFRNKYQHYVPLKGGPDEQLMVGTGKGLKVRHKEKRALGHPLRDGGEWIVEQLLADREATIMKAEKALLAKHVLQMAVEMQRPDIISVEQPKLRQVLKQKNAYVVTYKGSPVNSFQSLEAARVFRQMAGTMKGHHILDFDIVKSSDPQVVLMASPMLADNETMAYIGGHEIRMQINDDLLARAYGNLGQEALGPILRAGRALNTYLSKAYTGYNPEFILTNMIRDFTTGIANLSGEQGLRIAGKAVKHYPQAFMDLLRSTRGPGHVSQAIMDYREDGGNTGAAYLDDLERIGTNVQAEYAKMQGVVGNFRSGNISGAASAAIGKTLKPLIGWIEKLNQASENAMRLAIYQAMREAGKGRVQAASAAKNTTVNFNRKGEMGMAINAWWLFFNAAVQGTSAIAHAHFKGANKGQAWALSSSLIGTAYLASLAAAAGGDDDEDRYEKLSDYERSRNLIIKTENGYVKIPIPYGYGFFWNLGRTLADTQRTGKLGTAPWGLASNFLEEFTPFGSMVTGAQPDSKQAMLFMGPTAWQAFAVPAFNLTSFGSPLYPERSFQTAEFARDQMWRGTKGTWADELAGALEQAGLDVSPETLKHLWRTGTGGAGTFATSLFDLGQMSARGVEDFDAREIPFVRKVWTVPGVREARARYYQAVTEAETAKETFKRYKKKGDFEKAATYQGENQALISLADLASSTAKRIKAARDRYDAIKLDDDLSLPEKRRQMRELEVEETQIYDGYMRTFDERTRRVPN